MSDFLALGAGDSHSSSHACLASPLPVNHLPSSVLSHIVSPFFNGRLLLSILEPRLYQTPQADPSPGQECLPHLSVRTTSTSGLDILRTQGSLVPWIDCQCLLMWFSDFAS